MPLTAPCIRVEVGLGSAPRGHSGAQAAGAALRSAGRASPAQRASGEGGSVLEGRTLAVTRSAWK